MDMGFYVEDNSDIEQSKLNAAEKLFQTGDYNGALKIYLDMLNTSYSYNLYCEIGKCYYRLNDIDTAETYFKQSIDLESGKNPSYIFLGNINLKNGNMHKAIEYWLTSFSFKPDDENVCLNLGSTYLSLDMRFQSIMYYEKYLRYAKDKTSNLYLEIKSSIDKFDNIGEEFYQKALKAVSADDTETAIKALDYSVKNTPTNFDVNYLLGKLYYEQGNYGEALTYIKQAYCLDSKSIDVLQKLSSTLLALQDICGAYCCFKRMLPLVVHNQKEYLTVIQMINQLETKISEESAIQHLRMAQHYYNECNYHFALLEYENCKIIDNSMTNDTDLQILRIKNFLYPEDRIIKTCLDRGGEYYSNGNFRQANKYFTKIMKLSKPDSSDYKYARSRITSV